MNEEKDQWETKVGKCHERMFRSHSRTNVKQQWVIVQENVLEKQVSLITASLGEPRCEPCKTSGWLWYIAIGQLFWRWTLPANVNGCRMWMSNDITGWWTRSGNKPRQDINEECVNERSLIKLAIHFKDDRSCFCRGLLTILDKNLVTFAQWPSYFH